MIGIPRAGRRRQKVLIVCPYPKGGAPGQRFRFEQYLDILRDAGIDTEIAPFLSADVVKFLYKPGYYARKMAGVIAGFMRRCALMFRIFRYDYIFIFREASPIGPPLFEALMFLTRRRVIYDFDDAIFIPQYSKSNPIVGALRCSSKVSFISRHSQKVSVCNPFLVDWVSQRNPRVFLVPTTIDGSSHRPLKADRDRSGRIIIGWTGSHSTAKYLELVHPALLELQKKYDFEFRVICDHDPGFPQLKNYRFVPWRLESEVEDLATFDIGLMPVPDGAWEKGKVGFKAIQYSALEIAPVVSSTGSGREVVVEGETGLVVDNTFSAWHGALESLLARRDLIKKYGSAAREHILRHYSVASTAPTYIRLFQD